jgi:hypothetical protein
MLQHRENSKQCVILATGMKTLIVVKIRFVRAASDLQGSPDGPVQVLGEITQVIRVEPRHRNTAIVGEVNMCLVNERLRLLRIEAREAKHVKPAWVSHATKKR